MGSTVEFPCPYCRATLSASLPALLRGTREGNEAIRLSCRGCGSRVGLDVRVKAKGKGRKIREEEAEHKQRRERAFALGQNWADAVWKAWPAGKEKPRGHALDIPPSEARDQAAALGFAAAFYEAARMRWDVRKREEFEAAYRTGV